MRLSISANARADLREMHRYGREAYGELAAQAYLDSTLLAIERIPDWPLATRLRKEVRPPVRLWPHDVYNIFYDVAHDEVQILRVLHHTADWINLL